MEINLVTLEHQIQAIHAVTHIFSNVPILYNNPSYQNPLVDTKSRKIKDNISQIQRGEFEDIREIPFHMRGIESKDVLGIDVKMETGTGKTYAFTRLMLELNKRFAFNKFILLAPSISIREGTKSFINADYSKRHFKKEEFTAEVSLSVLEAQIRTGNRKTFPNAISDFARVDRYERNTVKALLTSGAMLLSNRTMDIDYDQTILGNFSNPYEALKETRPIVIIDEPHRFKRNGKVYKCIIEKLDPQCIIRFGATFPEIGTGKNKRPDYNNLVFDLGAVDSFNQGLVKGVAVQNLDKVSEDETVIKLMQVENGTTAFFRDEKTNKTYEVERGESLSIISDEFQGISVAYAGKRGGMCPDTQSLRLSNDHLVFKNDKIYPSIYGETYQELMIKQALKSHFKQEKENFMRQSKIKTLCLFFIDDIFSYRGHENDGHMKKQFENLLKKSIEEEIINININSERELLYKDFLEASLKDIGATNGGYFSKDNSNKDEDIKNEIDKILRDKEHLLSFTDDNGNWNTLRFIFSKWTLREGWDNPNVFTIAKLRSSGSEISKLQEVGRGLRLPVDELGNRIADEQFYLSLILDFSENDFANQLVDEVNKEVINLLSIGDLLNDIAKKIGKTPEKLFAELLTKGYVDANKNILADKRNAFFQEYPAFNKGINPDKIINDRDNKKGTVGIKKDKFEEIKHLWNLINQKYYIAFDNISDDELAVAVRNIFEKDEGNMFRENIIEVREQRTKKSADGISLETSTINFYDNFYYITYGDFLKKVYKSTSVPIHIIHNELVRLNKKYPLEDKSFHNDAVREFNIQFHNWMKDNFMQRYSFEKIETKDISTALTDIDGYIKDNISQGNIGVYKDDTIRVPESFIYEQFVYDSDKEKENIEKGNLESIVVFGKIPRRSIRIPVYYGGTTSPDFMYILEKENGDKQFNFIIETKGIEDKGSLREDEKYKIKVAKDFFKTLSLEGVKIIFKEQMNNDDVNEMINKIIN